MNLCVHVFTSIAPQLSKITSPLQDFLKADSHFAWDPDIHKQAFAKVKDTLSRAPALTFIDAEKTQLYSVMLLLQDSVHV